MPTVKMVTSMAVLQKGTFAIWTSGVGGGERARFSGVQELEGGG